jgi:oligopeptidase A
MGRAPSRHRAPHLAGQALAESLAVLLLVAVVGAAGFSSLGGAMDAAIVPGGEVANEGIDFAVPRVSPSAQAGIVASLRRGFRSLGAAPTEGAGSVRRVAPSARVLPDARALAEGIVPAWDRLGAHNLESVADDAIARASSRVDAVLKVEGPRTFDNTIRPLSNAVEDTYQAEFIANHLLAMIGGEPMQAAHGAATAKASAFRGRLLADDQVRAAVRAYHPGSENLTGPERRFVTTLREWTARPQGDAQTHARRAQLTQELSAAVRTYDSNLAGAREAFELWVEDPRILDGLPADLIEEARLAAAERGRAGYRFSYFMRATQEAPKRAHRADVRAWFGGNLGQVGLSGPFDVRPVAERIVALRRELRMLDEAAGAPGDAASPILGQPSDVEAFLRKRIEAATPAKARETEELLAYRRSVDGGESMGPADAAYFRERLENEILGGDLLRPYLSVDTVLEGIRGAAYTLLGARMDEVALPVWHPDVRSFAVHAEDGRLLGFLQFDMFSRPGKRGHAWQAQFVLGPDKAASSGAVVTNFPAPAAGAPALLTLTESSTLFHEVGHALHQLFSEASIPHQGGTRVAAELVEMPSLFFESWSKEPAALRAYARHFETGEPMPEALLERVARASRVGAATDAHGRLVGSLTDFFVHHGFDPAAGEGLYAFASRAIAEFYPHPIGPSYDGFAMNQNIFSFGQGGSFYRYELARVLGANALAKLESIGRLDGEGIFSAAGGRAFRDAVLAVGSTRHPLDVVRSLLRGDVDRLADLRRAAVVAD